MALQPDCPDCGYPQAQKARPAGSSRCTNPFCPDDPGQCPHCGRNGPHRVLMFASVQIQLRCTACGSEWTPPQASV